ncbi:unnamed protein product [Spirodela intermedia]|uniref:Uncharacterized protein n=1 Tax=Spirodela intermedia TaxID=51605 RepID=A0A7I8JMA8_SPIIN|nr:unnamed protein product [Spirodela intermedia]CAA6670713.1 unnamed protein product [Spirodela intermedia]
MTTGSKLTLGGDLACRGVGLEVVEGVIILGTNLTRLKVNIRYEAIQMAEKGIPSSSSVTQETDSKSEVPASSSGSVVNDPTKGGSLGSSCGSVPQIPHGGISPLAEDNSVAESTKVECALSPPVDTKHGPANVVSAACRQPTPTSNQFPFNMVAPVYVAPASDAVLVPSIDTHVSDGTNECEVENKETTLEHPIRKGVSHGLPDSGMSYEKTSSESGSSFMQGKMATKSQGQELNYFSSSGSKPSSNYGSRSQQVVGPQKGINGYFLAHLFVSLSVYMPLLVESMNRKKFIIFFVL